MATESKDTSKTEVQDTATTVTDDGKRDATDDDKPKRDRSETPDKVRGDIEATVDKKEPLEFVVKSNEAGPEIRANLTAYVDVTTEGRADNEKVAINLGTLRAIVRAFVKQPNVGNPDKK